MKGVKGIIAGVGINDADYHVAKRGLNPVTGKMTVIWQCPYYTYWKSMISRCYQERELKRRPTYEDKWVCDEWLTFSNFKRWMEKQDWEGCQLDKDILVNGNKVYSPDTCMFVPQIVNIFYQGRSQSKYNWPVGTSYQKMYGKFVSQCSNPFTGKVETLGRFDNPIDAHNLWKKRKNELAHKLAHTDLVTDERIRQSLLTRWLPNINHIHEGAWTRLQDLYNYETQQENP